MGLGTSWSKSTSVKNFVKYDISCAALAVTAHSSLAEEAAVHFCFLEVQLITLFPNRNRFPDTDLRSLRSLAQSESAYAFKTVFSIFV